MKPKIAWLAMPLPTADELARMGDEYELVTLVPPPIAEQWRSAETAWAYAVRQCGGVPYAVVSDPDVRFLAELLSATRLGSTRILVRAGAGSFEQVQQVQTVTTPWEPQGAGLVLVHSVRTNKGFGVDVYGPPGWEGQPQIPGRAMLLREGKITLIEINSGRDGDTVIILGAEAAVPEHGSRIWKGEICVWQL